MRLFLRVFMLVSFIFYEFLRNYKLYTDKDDKGLNYNDDNVWVNQNSIFIFRSFFLQF